MIGSDTPRARRTAVVVPAVVVLLVLVRFAVSVPVQPVALLLGVLS